MSCYAIYRLPHTTQAVRLTQSEGQPETTPSYTELSGKEGFVFAPFSPSEDCPILLLKPDRYETFHIDADNNSGSENYTLHTTSENGNGRDTYSGDFARFHSKLCNGEYSKLVLARCSREKNTTTASHEQLFARACRLYPRLFIALVSTPQGGTWLMATPEILLEGKDNTFATMALAGTMRLDDTQLGFDTQGCDPYPNTIKWDSKNIQEQEYVAAYIKERINRFSDNIKQNGPYTARAGRIVHLRTDFSFTLHDTGHIGDVINSLHPTPAVCGIPKDKARRFILDNETDRRKYYSGFCGPLSHNGETHLYVSLRCMEITEKIFCLHAGGGLLDKSEEQHEWDETEYKMDTMRWVINTNQEKCTATRKM